MRFKFLLVFVISTTPNMEGQRKWTSVFYWTNYPSLLTLDMFNARYLHFAETLDKFTNEPKLVGYVQFKTPMTVEDLHAISPDIHWVDQRGANMTVMNFIDRVGYEGSNNVTRLGTPFAMRERQQPPPAFKSSLSMREREQPSALLSPNARSFSPTEEPLTPRDQPTTPFNTKFAKKERKKIVNI